jgi:glutaconate CoA-transferase subunit B
VLASGIGIVPRLGASLAKADRYAELLMTDAEATSSRSRCRSGRAAITVRAFAGYMGLERVFDCVWSGRRHVMIGRSRSTAGARRTCPVSATCAAQGADARHARTCPVTAPSANSMFVPNHNKRVFVEGEVDIVGGVGYNRRRWPEGARRDQSSICDSSSRICAYSTSAVADHAIPRALAAPGRDVRAGPGSDGFQLLGAATCR